MSAITVSLIQSNLHWEDKQANLQQFSEKILGIEKTQIVVLPEMFSTGFSMQPARLAETMEGETVHWMKTIAAQKKIILTGSLIIEEEGNYFNRLIWMLPNGKYGYYDKRHLFGYAGEQEQYTAGQKRLIASVNGWKVNLQVCYDLRFPVWARQQMYPAANPNPSQEIREAVQEGSLPPADVPGNLSKDAPAAPEYDLLVYVANWPERRNHAWKTLLQARAIENQCYVIGVNRVGNDGHAIYHSGDSMVIDPLGEILFTQAHEEAVFTTTLQKSRLDELRNKLPFLKDADDFMISG